MSVRLCEDADRQRRTGTDTHGPWQQVRGHWPKVCGLCELLRDEEVSSALLLGMAAGELAPARVRSPHAKVPSALPQTGLPHCALVPPATPLPIGAVAIMFPPFLVMGVTVLTACVVSGSRNVFPLVDLRQQRGEGIRGTIAETIGAALGRRPRLCPVVARP